jgi:meiotic recombination protein SPO11
MTRVMQLIYDVLRKGIHVTKRDLFYTDVKLFADQVSCSSTLWTGSIYLRSATEKHAG